MIRMDSGLETIVTMSCIRLDFPEWRKPLMMPSCYLVKPHLLLQAPSEQR